MPDDRIESVCWEGASTEVSWRSIARSRGTHLEELEVRLAEAVQHKLDLEEEGVGAEL